MSGSTVAAIYRKEMLDTIRDRRTLISMVVVPLAAMPLFFLAIGRFATSAQRRAGEEALTIAVRNADRVPGLLNGLAAGGFRVGVRTDDLKKAVERKDIAAGVEPVDAAGGATEVLIYADLTRQASELAAARARAALDRFKENGIRVRLLAMGLPGTVLDPFRVRRVNVAAEQKMAGFLWGNLFGYFVVILMFSGGMYPAIDMTAGEKERRTMEVLLSSPARRGEIILGKILAATSAVYLTALLSIVSVVASLRYTRFGAASRYPFDAPAIALALAALLPLAVMAASLMIAVALFAKSFKEAQSYLTPLVMAAIFPMLIGFLPGIQLTPALALVPLFNVCQLIREIFQGEYSRAAFAVTMLANIVYAGAAFFAAVRVFSSERVLFRT